MDLKAEIQKLHDSLSALETAARKLPNQNFADIVKSAKAKVQQMGEHPDVDRAGEQMEAYDGYEGKQLKTDMPPQGEKFPYDKPKDDGAKHPGDPTFQQSNNNPDFKHPENVDLNKDGTLQRAPNSLGTSADVREE